tara:strand:- start:661 stop:1080 length:420 start_codon:yes stop_codon:yes gene_type:complete
MITINSQTRENKMLKEKKINKNKKSISLKLDKFGGYNNSPHVNLDNISYAKSDNGFVTKGIKIEVSKGLSIEIDVHESGYAYIDIRNHLHILDKNQNVLIRNNNHSVDEYDVDVITTRSRASNCLINVSNHVKQEGMAV